MRAGVDVDGVLFDFYAAFMDVARASGFAGLAAELDGGEPARWHFYRDWGWNDDEWHDQFTWAVTHGRVFARTKPRPGAREALQRLRDAGHTIHLVTDRNIGAPGVAEAQTREWLYRHRIPYDTLTLTADKTSVPCDVFVEDKADNARALDAAGVATWLVDRPWNRGEDAGEYVFRTESVSTFVDEFLAGGALLAPRGIAGGVTLAELALPAFWQAVLDDRGGIDSLRGYGEDTDVYDLATARYEAAKAGPTTATCEETGEVLTTPDVEPPAEWERELLEAASLHPDDPPAAFARIDGEVRSVSATGGEKGVKPERYDLLPVDPIAALARHYGVGARKYAAHNWRRGYEWSKSYAALMRHLQAFWSGEDVDAETGSLHMVAVMFHAAALTEYQLHPDVYGQHDDRYRP